MKAKMFMYIVNCMPHLDFLPPVIEHIYPYKNGAGRNPIKLKQKLAKALELGLNSGSTDYNITPVIRGIIIPPTYIMHHRRILII